MLCWRLTNFRLKLFRGLCAVVRRASIGLPVHRFGNRCKTLSSAPPRLPIRSFDAEALAPKANLLSDCHPERSEGSNQTQRFTEGSSTSASPNLDGTVTDPC